MTITILNFNDGKVYQHVGIDTDKITEDSWEEWLIAEGYKPGDCEWMIHEDNEIIKND
tara:strand:- start:103 stop:276 length:174 start_codon:yes stop_codon:yes gene_type:complete